MRRLTLLLLFVVTTINMMCAQVPQGFTYQAIVRNNDGTTIANSQVSVRIELVHGSANGTVQYAENHSPLTDANGLFFVLLMSKYSLKTGFNFNFNLSKNSLLILQVETVTLLSPHNN